MDYKQIIERLEIEYPGSKLVKLPEENPTEILCELDPTEHHPEYSVAISVIDRSVPHHHELATEEYEVLDGELSVFVDGVETKLVKGDSLKITPPSVHFAVGNQTWIKCISKPGWTLDDHIMEDTQNEGEL